MRRLVRRSVLAINGGLADEGECLALDGKEHHLVQPLVPPSPSKGSHDPECQEVASEEGDHHEHHRQTGSSWQAVTTALLSLQLGWGLWLFPCDYARLGWCAHGILVVLALLTSYSGFLFTRLYQLVPGVVLFSDVGKKAAGNLGATLVSVIVYSLDATRCIILHLAATQSLRHMFTPETQPPLWQCGLVVFIGASLLVQVRSMAEMSWVFMTGTASQLVAVGIVVWELVYHPLPHVQTEWVTVKSDNLAAPAVAVMNMIFAFGGQFAFTEIMASMRQPRHFPRAVSICTVVMTCLYGGMGTIGYLSRGASINGIIIFSLPESPRARVAAGCILVQAAAQYLINVNVWTHNLLVLVARRNQKEGSVEVHERFKTSADHNKWRWMWVSVFVVAYSYAISMTLPFFSTLVGLVTSVTYLMCAYVLPAWFMLKLVGAQLWAPERWLLVSLIPISIIVSLIGLWGSIMALMHDLGVGGEGWK